MLNTTTILSKYSLSVTFLNFLCLASDVPLNLISHI